MTEATVFVVDDDAAMRDSLTWLMRSVGLAIETFPSAQAFLDGYRDDRPGCLVLDIRMPGMSGLDLQDSLNAAGIRLPVIVITGHGDVPMAVRALKQGACEFIEKPFSDQLLLDCVQRAIARDRSGREQDRRYSDIAALYAQLTPREQEVMARVVSGQSNKRIGADLGISQKTVEAHRAKVMEKMQVRSVSELVRRAMVLEDAGGKP